MSNTIQKDPKGTNEKASLTKQDKNLLKDSQINTIEIIPNTDEKFSQQGHFESIS